MRSPRSRVAVLVAASLLLAACGGGDDNNNDNAAADRTTTTAGESATDADDEELAGAVVLKLADFPPGWTEGEAPTDEESADDDPVDECLGEEGKELESATTGEGESPDFSRGETTQAGSFSAVLRTEADAKKGFKLLAGDAFEGCILDAMKSSLAEEVDAESTIGEVTTKPSSFPTVGDETTAYQVRIPLEVGAESATFFTEFVFFREGRVLAGLFFFNMGEPLEASVQVSLAKKMAARASA